MRSLFILLLLVSVPCTACTRRHLPDASELDRYSKVFTGRVAGVEIVQGDWSFGGWSERHNLYIQVESVFKGEVLAMVTLKSVHGCALPIPLVDQDGIFFVTVDGLIEPVYRSETTTYGEVLSQLEGR